MPQRRGTHFPKKGLLGACSPTCTFCSLPRVLQDFLEESVSLVLWVRRVSQGRPETQDPRDPQESLGPREKLVKRETQAHLGLLDLQARKAPLERMEQKGMWAPRGCQET